MTRQQLIKEIKMEFEPRVYINTFLADKLIDMVLDYAVIEIDVNIIEVIKNLKVKQL